MLYRSTNLISASRLGWHHTYGSSHVQETMAVLKDKMNKKCVRSYLKSEANNYQRSSHRSKCPDDHLLTLPKRSTSRTRMATNAIQLTSWLPFPGIRAQKSSKSLRKLLVASLGREARRTSSFRSMKISTRAVTRTATGSWRSRTIVKGNTQTPSTASPCIMCRQMFQSSASAREEPELCTSLGLQR